MQQQQQAMNQQQQPVSIGQPQPLYATNQPNINLLQHMLQPERGQLGGIGAPIGTIGVGLGQAGEELGSMYGYEGHSGMNI